jgi:hypothetical protein
MIRNNMQKVPNPLLRPSGAKAAQARLRRSNVERIFELDGAHVVLYPAAPAGFAALDALASLCRDRYLTLVVEPREAGIDSSIEQYARSAQGFDRIIVCDGEGALEPSQAARALERAVRRAGRVECKLVPDSRRALRHCIDGLIPGDIVACSCGNVDAALAILEEYGASEAAEIPGGRRRSAPPSAVRATLGGAAPGASGAQRV